MEYETIMNKTTEVVGEYIARIQQSLVREKRRIGAFHLVVLVVGLGCLVYWGNGNHLAVEVPVQDGAIIQRLQGEIATLQRQKADYQTLAANLAAQVKSRNITIAQYEQQLKVLSVSVPPQAVILQAVVKESSTPAGLRQMVARNFGKDIAAHIQIIKE